MTVARNLDWKGSIRMRKHIMVGAVPQEGPAFTLQPSDEFGGLRFHHKNGPICAYLGAHQLIVNVLSPPARRWSFQTILASALPQ